MPLHADTIEASIDVNATPARVWALVGDARNMSRWSPQLVRSFSRGGGSGAGARYLNVNRMGFLVWPTRSTVVIHDAEREIAWRVKDNYTVWGLRLEAIEGGTRLTQYRRAPEGISDVSVKLTNGFMGGVEKFTRTLQADMGKTLARIKADVEG